MVTLRWLMSSPIIVILSAAALCLGLSIVFAHPASAAFNPGKVCNDSSAPLTR
jgi:hypothetical protein